MKKSNSEDLPFFELEFFFGDHAQIQQLLQLLQFVDCFSVSRFAGIFSCDGKQRMP